MIWIDYIVVGWVIDRFALRGSSRWGNTDSIPRRSTRKEWLQINQSPSRLLFKFLRNSFGSLNPGKGGEWLEILFHRRGGEGDRYALKGVQLLDYEGRKESCSPAVDCEKIRNRLTFITISWLVLINKTFCRHFITSFTPMKGVGGHWGGLGYHWTCNEIT